MSDTTCTNHNDQQRTECPVCLVTVLTALVAADAAQLASALVQLGVAATVADGAGLELDLTRLLARYRDVELQDLKLTEVVGDLMEVVRRRDLRFPSRIALLLKTVVMCEGVAAQLDPAFRLIPLLVPYAVRLATPPEVAEPRTPPDGPDAPVG